MKVLRKSSESPKKILRKSSEILQKILRKTSESHQKVSRKSSESLHRVLKKASKSPQEVIRKSSIITQKVIRKSSEITLNVHEKSSEIPQKVIGKSSKSPLKVLWPKQTNSLANPPNCFFFLIFVYFWGKGLERQRLIGSPVAGFNHARTITIDSATVLDTTQDDHNKGLCLHASFPLKGQVVFDFQMVNSSISIEMKIICIKTFFQ